MKPRVVVPTAEAALDEIHRFIASGDPRRADDFLAAAEAALAGFDERFLPARAHEALPDHVRSVRIPGFRGYVLWVAATPAVIAVVAAFRPGLPPGRTAGRGRAGLADLPPDDAGRG